MAKLTLDGVEHEFSEELNLGEARVLKRYTGMNLREVENADPSDPDLITAFAHIVYRRENPTLTFAELEAMAEAVDLASMDTTTDGTEVAASPPAPSAGISDSETTQPSNGSLEASPEIDSRETTGTPV